MKKLPRDAEASNVLVGEVDFLDSPFVAFVRLQQAVMLGALTEVPVPTRWLRFVSELKEFLNISSSKTSESCISPTCPNRYQGFITPIEICKKIMIKKV